MPTKAGPDIVNDAIKAYLDASNPASYPGTGSAWYNITPNQEVYYPTTVKNIVQPLNEWPLKRSIITEITDGSISPPFSGSRVWSSQRDNATYSGTLHRTGYSSATLPMTASLNMKYYQYSMYIRGDSNNSSTAGAQMDISDGAGTSLTIGTGSNWQKVYVLCDNSSGNPGKFLDYTLLGEDGDKIYISAIALNTYIIPETKAARAIETEITDYLDYGETLEIIPPSQSFNIQLVNSPTFIEAGTKSYMEVDGTNEYFQLDDYLDFTKGTSVRMVVKSETTGSTSEYITLFGDSRGFFELEKYNTILSRHSADTRTIRPYLFTSTTEFTSSLSLDREFNDICLVAEDDTSFKMYVNGTLQLPTGSVEGSIKLNGILKSSANAGLAIFQFYNKALTAEEVRQTFNAQKSRFNL